MKWSAIFLSFALGGCSPPSTQTNSSLSFDRNSAIVVGAVQLSDEFNANAVSASDRYGNASIILKGWVVSVEEGQGEMAIVNLNAGGGIPDVKAEVDRSLVVDLVPHDDLKLSCVGAGKEGWVRVHECRDMTVVSHDKPLENL